jgi:hypothetical protein
MTELGAVLEQLKQERKRAEGELRQLEEVIAALSKMTGHSRRSSRFGKRAKHRLSAAARERIAAAQRARWAKVRAKAKKSS